MTSESRVIYSNEHIDILSVCQHTVVNRLFISNITCTLGDESLLPNRLIYHRALHTHLHSTLYMYNVI